MPYITTIYELVIEMKSPRVRPKDKWIKGAERKVMRRREHWNVQVSPGKMLKADTNNDDDDFASFTPLNIFLHH